FGGARLDSTAFPAMDGAIDTVDFSGWAFFCRRDQPARLAYDMALAVDRCRDRIEADHLDRRAMTMADFCRGSDGGPLTIPLHPGARKYYREKGYL
ncbi:MAG TPA: TAXI family TRAP transporter solute-binding subunit, partial [Candidatus Binatia bacterium]